MASVMTTTIEKPQPKDKYPTYKAESVHNKKLCLRAGSWECTCTCGTCTEYNER